MPLFISVATVVMMVLIFWFNFKKHPTIMHAVLELIVCACIFWLTLDPPGIIWTWFGEYGYMLYSLVGMHLAGVMGSFTGRFLNENRSEK